MAISKKMTVSKKASLTAISNALSNADILGAQEASVQKPYVRIDLAQKQSAAGGVTTIKDPFLLIPIADLAAQFPTIFSSLGPTGISAAMVEKIAGVPTNIIFVGDSDQDFS